MEPGEENQERRGYMKGKRTRVKERMKMWGGDERWRDVEQRI